MNSLIYQDEEQTTIIPNDTKTSTFLPVEDEDEEITTSAVKRTMFSEI